MKNKKNIFILILIAINIFLSPGWIFALEIPPVGNSDNTGGTIPDPISINLIIEGPDSVIFNNTITVSACSPEQISLPDNLDGQSLASSTPTVNAYCAILQSGIPNTWTSFGDDKFLDSLNGISNDFIGNHYWTWFNNLEYGQTALNKHILSNNENLLITISRMPLKISVSTLTPVVGSTTTISVLEFGFDSSFNGVWLPSPLSSVSINNENFETNNLGVYDFFVSTSTPFYITGRKTGFLDSTQIIVSPEITSDIIPPTEPEGDTENIIPPSGGGGGGISINNNNIDVNKAVQFLSENQKEDGSFGSPIYTDWAAIALASAPENQAKEKIKKYLKESDPSFNSVTDYERHAMALMALGISPFDGTRINYIKKITDSFDGVQIGDKNLVNDDIFAIFPLMKSGYSKDDLVVQKILSFIVSRQGEDGSWEKSIDLTASAVQAFSLFTTSPEINLAINRAKAYLLREQKPDAGFGSSFSTSWVIQAIAATGDSNFNWIKNYSTPNNYLYSLQQSDGGIELISKDKNTRIWATAYVIPAVLNKTWNSVLVDFSKQENSGQNLGINSGSGMANELLSTTTVVATSTISLVATSTLSEVISATSSDFIIIQATTSATTTSTIIKNRLKAKTLTSGIKIFSQATTTSLVNENVASVGVNKNNIVENIIYFFTGLLKKIFW